MSRLRRRAAALHFVLAVLALATVPTRSAGATPARINGSGSTYVGLAMQQWVAEAQANGLPVGSYDLSGSPKGLSDYAQSTVDFAATEAEYSALGYSGGVRRGYQYVPDVAGAVAILYNVVDKAGRKIDYLHLSRETIARIFIGDISRWSDPAISADNKGLELPDEPVRVVYRQGQSGTTALFYDFVQHTIPEKFDTWAKRNELPTDVRIVDLGAAPQFAPNTVPQAGSNEIAGFIKSNAGRWAIGYDEYGYADKFTVPAAWVQNQAGQWVLPYAQNISAALESARLRPDLSQELANVYDSANPEAYPISAYSYLVTQCAPSADRETCKGPYVNTGVAETLALWMRYIACEGQVTMADIGYSPLPPHLSQEVANSIGRMLGKPPETLSAANCANPRFKGSLGRGATAPKDPLKDVPSLETGAGPAAGATTRATAGPAKSRTRTRGSAAAAAGDPAAVASDIAADLSDLASDIIDDDKPLWRTAQPVAYDRPVPTTSGSLPLVLLLIAVIAPLALPTRRTPFTRSGGENAAK